MTSDNPYHHGNLRNALISAGLELLRTKGIGGLTLRATARLAGVSANAPYRHFKDSTALACAIAEQGFAFLIDSLEAASKDLELEKRPPLDRLGIGYFRFAQANPDHLRLMFSGRIPPDSRSEELQAIGEAAFERLVSVATQVAPNSTPQQLALAAWALVHGFSSLSVEGLVPTDENESPEALFSQCQAIFRNGWSKLS